MRIDRVVVGMDFSAGAVAGARWAAAMLAPEGELVLAHAVHVPPLPAFARLLGLDAGEMAAAANAFARTQMRAVTDRLPADSARIVLRDGAPDDVVLDVAMEESADLVVIGAHGRRVRAWKPLGTTGERIARASAAPVLVVRGEPRRPPVRLLVAIEEDDAAPQALRWAGELAGRFAGEVTVLHVLSNAVYAHAATMLYAGGHGDSVAARELRDDLREEGIAWLDTLAAGAIARAPATSVVTFGDAGDATLALAESMSADLIVIGRRGTGVVAPALLGSTVGTVLHGAPCPVLVVPGE